MTKIKIVGAIIFSLSVVLVLLFNHISEQSKINNDLLNTINLQKSFTQEISKSIFYIYKDRTTSHEQLDNSIKKFVKNMEYKNENFSEISCIYIDNQNKKIAKLWNYFYLSVQNFRDQSKIKTAYSNILIEQSVKNIYNTNLIIIVEFDKLIELHEKYFNNKLNTYKNIQYVLFALLILLLIYLFTQIKIIISFIQKFLNTSKNIITQSSIKELKPLEVHNNSSDLLEAANNFNHLVDKINESIKHSSSSIEHSQETLEVLENNIENLLDLINSMDDGKIDKGLTKKEDALIESMEELTSCAQKLQDVKVKLDDLISHKNL